MVETYGTQNLLNTKTYHTKHLTLRDGLGPMFGMFSWIFT